MELPFILTHPHHTSDQSADGDNSPINLSSALADAAFAEVEDEEDVDDEDDDLSRSHACENGNSRPQSDLLFDCSAPIVPVTAVPSQHMSPPTGTAVPNLSSKPQMGLAAKTASLLATTTPSHTGGGGHIAEFVRAPVDVMDAFPEPQQKIPLAMFASVGG